MIEQVYKKIAESKEQGQTCKISITVPTFFQRMLELSSELQNLDPKILAGAMATIGLCQLVKDGEAVEVITNKNGEVVTETILSQKGTVN